MKWIPKPRKVERRAGTTIYQDIIIDLCDECGVNYLNVKYIEINPSHIIFDVLDRHPDDNNRIIVKDGEISFHQVISAIRWMPKPEDED